MAGPWVGIAAPGENITSVGNADGGGLANALPNDQGEFYALNSASFAAAYVSGVAALVRSRFPELTAEQVVRPADRRRAGRGPRAVEPDRRRARRSGRGADVGCHPVRATAPPTRAQARCGTAAAGTTGFHPAHRRVRRHRRAGAGRRRHGRSRRAPTKDGDT